MIQNPYPLSSEQALKKGADLWIVSDPKHSPWNQQIDWYLSFLMKKSRKDEKPLLMQTSEKRPNLWTIELAYKNNQLWLNQAHTMWKNLNRPSLRIFAPYPITTEEIQKTWQGETIPIQTL